MREVDLTAVSRVGLEEARRLWERGEAVFVDVRGEERYRERHIPGARWVALRDMVRRSGELPPEATIITY